MAPATLTCAQARTLDRMAIDELGMPGLVLMENAGRGVAESLDRLFGGRPLTDSGAPPALIVCGSGNNGGDGFVIARHLDLRGWQVSVCLVFAPDRIQGDALANYRWLAETNVTLIHQLDDWTWNRDSSKATPGLATPVVIDAMLGTGARGELRDPLPSMIDRLHQLSAYRVAIDVPTGLDADTGKAHVSTFRADRTYTMVAAKPGLLLPATASFVGELEVVDIGVPSRLFERVELNRK